MVEKALNVGEILRPANGALVTHELVATEKVQPEPIHLARFAVLPRPAEIESVENGQHVHAHRGETNLEHAAGPRKIGCVDVFGRRAESMQCAYQPASIIGRSFDPEVNARGCPYPASA